MSAVAVKLDPMTELAYMVREDWGQHGTAMVPSSARIRDWLGAAPLIFAVTELRKFNDKNRNADLEAAEYIAPKGTKLRVVNIADLTRLTDHESASAVAVVALHPYEQGDLETLRKVIGSASFGRVFVLIWSPRDVIRTWLDAHGAVDLHTGESLPAPDQLQVAAAELMVNEEYNGLSSGRGKDVVIQLLRAFTTSGYPLDESWLRAFFAAGGSFRHAESVKKFISEMKSGINHRVRPAFRTDILDILRTEINNPTGDAHESPK